MEIRITETPMLRLGNLLVLAELLSFNSGKNASIFNLNVSCPNLVPF